MDERPHILCCETADDEALANEPELFCCETCPVAQASEALWPENAAAWRLFQALSSRWVVEAQLAPEVFRRSTEAMDPDAVIDLNARLSVIYDRLYPKKTT